MRIHTLLVLILPALLAAWRITMGPARSCLSRNVPLTLEQMCTYFPLWLRRVSIGQTLYTVSN
jgi:hypothetical protein